MLLFCKVTSKDLLPPICALLANAPAKSRRDAITQEVDYRALDVNNAATSVPPIITKAIIAELTLACAFGARDTNDLTKAFSLSRSLIVPVAPVLPPKPWFSATTALTLHGHAAPTLAEQDALSAKTFSPSEDGPGP
jgi:hypothetical protein